jgi:hypothetical protein
MDYSVAGHDVDAKFTIGLNWSIPLEAANQICLLINADDRNSAYRVGLLRIEESYLNLGPNRDKKRGLSKEGRAAIKWLILNGRLPENILLHLQSEDRAAIFAEPNGQRRTNELFRRVQGRIINRATVLTVARQDDSPKRVRDARIQLRSEGIIILGHQKAHQHIATTLQLPAPNSGEWIAIRVAPASEGSGRPSVKIGDITYEIARAGDPATEGPRMP